MTSNLYFSLNHNQKMIIETDVKLKGDAEYFDIPFIPN